MLVYNSHHLSGLLEMWKSWGVEHMLATREGVGIFGKEQQLEVPFLLVSVFPFMQNVPLSVVYTFHSSRGSDQ